MNKRNLNLKNEESLIVEAVVDIIIRLIESVILSDMVITASVTKLGWCVTLERLLLPSKLFKIYLTTPQLFQLTKYQLQLYRR